MEAFVVQAWINDVNAALANSNIRFNTVSDIEKVLPKDLKTLVDSLARVEAAEFIIPGLHRDHPSLQSSKVHAYSWQHANEQANLAILQADLTYLQKLVEIARDDDFLQVEPITPGGIASTFRTGLENGRYISSEESEPSAPEHGNNSASSQTRSNFVASSVNKMVDFPPVLQHHGSKLETLIWGFFKKQPLGENAVNQTMYEPVPVRPACLFIETTTSIGTIDTANYKLGVWVGAWQERMRSIIVMAGSQEKVLTIPVVQVHSSICVILFLVDIGSEIIGDTDSLVRMYQIQAAIVAIASWAKETYEAWLTDSLEHVTSARVSET
ncbi:hypothetical protein FSARC_13104 [Fusarium sarcochroum]|uniref:PD-(D/E)XK nuclease-like domain-containing protein n=1 Tax=Fusarium sarcochroum TaxID=1208366 RepID=A0A8H4T3K7_9HYPO|nr:hypothetical protein FSARC_13104 [Fusarium sarcochroum]